MFEPTTKSAIEYARQDKLDVWVEKFLCGEGNNKSLLGALKRDKIEYENPKLMDLTLLRRLVGFEPEMEIKLTEEQFEGFLIDAYKIAERFSNENWDMPPLMAFDFSNVNWNIPPLMAYDESASELHVIFDGNHRFEALKKLGIKEYWVILLKSPQKDPRQRT